MKLITKIFIGIGILTFIAGLLYLVFVITPEVHEIRVNKLMENNSVKIVYPTTNLTKEKKDEIYNETTNETKVPIKTKSSGLGKEIKKDINFSTSKYELLCLGENETIEFSKCNSAMKDRVCETKLCQYCVYKGKEGFNCPAKLDKCGEKGCEL